MSESLREKSNKKLCFVTTVSITLKSFVVGTAEYLHQEAGYDITFICDDDEAFVASLPPYIHYVPIPMKRGISLGGIGAMLKMARVFRREKFDMVQYSTPNASLYAALASKLAGVPVRLYCQWGMAYVGFHGIKRAVFKSIEKLVCSLSTWVEPDSFGNLKFSHSEGLYPENKGSVIWNGSASGVNLKKFDISQKTLWREEIRGKCAIPSDAVVFGFVGRITRDKGINELLSAFKTVLAELPNSYLLIVGNPEITPAVDMSLYQWAQENPHSVFCGSTNIVEQYLSAMDAYILPSYREGFGMVVVEAEAMGVPVIVTDIPGPTDAMIPDETGLLVKKADVDSLVAAMKELALSPEKRQRFGAAAQKFAAENFEQQHLFQAILQDRRRLLGEE